MAGGDYHPFRSDPAIERWSAMHSTMYQRFRFTPQRTRQVLVWGAIVPFLTYSLASYADGKWDIRGKTRGESLLRVPPKSVEGEGDED